MKIICFLEFFRILRDVNKIKIKSSMKYLYGTEFEYNFAWKKFSFFLV